MSRFDYIYDYGMFGWLSGMMTTVSLYNLVEHPVLATIGIILSWFYFRWSIPEQLVS